MRHRIGWVVAAMLALMVTPATAHDSGSHEPQPRSVQTEGIGKAAADEEKARRYFTDRMVINQYGEKLRFFSDVLKDHVVLVSLFFTKCDSACPIINQAIADIRDAMDDEMRRKVLFVSLSLDPVTDTPEVLKDYAANFGADRGWYFLTGTKEDLTFIARRLGHVSPTPETHDTTFVVGNVPQAHWTKVPPNHPPKAIVERLRQVMGAPGMARASAP